MLLAQQMRRAGNSTRSPVARLGISVAHDAETAQWFAYRAGRDGANILPLLYRAKKLGEIDLPPNVGVREVAATVAEAWDAGFDAIIFSDYITADGKSKTFVLVRHPSQLRSPHAAFDPDKKDSANILAANGVPAVMPALGALLLDEPRHAEEAKNSKWRGT